MLKRASLINRTPSDIFNELLLGQAVIIDHGLDLFPEYRAISIYAHLSSIIPKFEVGYNIKSGEIFGYSGNTGTSPSTKGTKDAPLISVILECLYVLSYDSAIRKICNEGYAPGNDTFGFGIMSVLKKYDGMGDIKDLVISSIFISDRLFIKEQCKAIIIDPSDCL